MNLILDQIATEEQFFNLASFAEAATIPFDERRFITLEALPETTGAMDVLSQIRCGGGIINYKQTELLISKQYKMYGRFQEANVEFATAEAAENFLFWAYNDGRGLVVDGQRIFPAYRSFPSGYQGEATVLPSASATRAFSVQGLTEYEYYTLVVLFAGSSVDKKVFLEDDTLARAKAGRGIKLTFPTIAEATKAMGVVERSFPDAVWTAYCQDPASRKPLFTGLDGGFKHVAAAEAIWASITDVAEDYEMVWEDSANWCYTEEDDVSTYL